MADPVDRLGESLSDRYRIERELGAGGMARVYLAEDLKHKRKVAIKVLDPELAAVVGAERFLAEIETTAALQHPHILPLFDSGEADGFVYYVMPYIEGESLRDRLDREGQLPVEDAVAIARHVADALDYAHRQGVVHRDVKPANVMLHDGKPIVADFGIALAVDAAGGRLTGTGLSVGTPLYMSPEQASGAESIGPRSDIYSLGCVLYEMLVGSPPHTGRTPTAIIGRIMAGSIDPPRERRPTVPRHVDAAVRKALERLPADRFATARGFAEALVDPTFSHGDERDAPSRKVTWLAAAGWGTALVLAGVVASSMGTRDRAATGTRHFSIVLPPGTTLPAGVHGSVEIDPRGDRLFYVVEHPDGQREIHSRSFSESEGAPVGGAAGLIGDIFLSPDGRSIGFFDLEEGVIKRVPASGGPTATVVETGLRSYSLWQLGADWGPEGTIVFVAEDRPIYRVPVTGGAPREVFPPDTSPGLRYRQPSFLPDGSGIVFTVSRTSNDRYLHQVALFRFGEDREPVFLVEGHSPRVTPDGHLVFARGLDDRQGAALWAARLDADAGRLEDAPVRVLQGGLVTNYSTHIAISAEGTLAYLPGRVGPPVAELVWAHRDGRRETILRSDSPQLPDETVGFAAPRVSPDGGRIAFRSLHYEEPRYRLSVLDLQRGVVHTIPMDQSADWPVWTPDGERLVFNRFTEDQQNLYQVPADGIAPPAPLMPHNPRQQHAGSFTPDGGVLVLQERFRPRAADSDIRQFSMDGADDSARMFIATPAMEIQPALSSDGAWLAYVSDESGQRAVYVTDFPGRTRRLKVSSEEAWMPAWDADGTELFYVGRDSPEEGWSALKSVAVRSENGRLHAGVPELLFEASSLSCCDWGRNYDVAPGGERFVLIELEERARTPRVEVIENWTESW